MSPIRHPTMAVAIALVLAFPVSARADSAPPPAGSHAAVPASAPSSHVTTVKVRGRARSHIYWGPLLSGVFRAVFGHPHRHVHTHVHADVYVTPTPAAPAPAPAPEPGQAPAAKAKTARLESWLGMTAHRNSAGPMVGFGLLTEGKRWGLTAGISGPVGPEGTRGAPTRVGIAEARLTWSPVSGERGRLRLEAGVSSALSPRVASLGVDTGVSGELRLVGPLGIEGGVYVTRRPHQRKEARFAGTLEVGSLRLLGGIRRLEIESAVPRLDGERECYAAPFVGAGLVF
jgi:hypothetical protein